MTPEELPERLREVADNLDDFCHPITGPDDCRAAADYLADILNATRAVMDEVCAEGEKHCSCVPLLRARLSVTERILEHYRIGDLGTMGFISKYGRLSHRYRMALEKIAAGDSIFGAQAAEYKQIARAALTQDKVKGPS